MVHGDNIIYVRIDWENYPSDKTPVNERNLNKMDLALRLLDDRVVWLNENKFDKTESFKLVKDISLNEENGVFTITFYDDSKKQIDTILEKIAVNFDFDEERQQLIITLDDGTEKRVDLSALITQYEFLTSETISPEVENGKVKFEVREGSIQEKHLRPDYLADIRVEQGKAQLSAGKSEEFAKLSESYAHGGTGVREGEDADNSMEYARQAKESADRAGEIVSGGLVTGVKGENEINYRTGNISIGLLDLCWNYSVGFGGTISGEWKDTDIYGETLRNGIYIVQAIVGIYDGLADYTGRYAGIINWDNAIYGFSEEILLNFSGRTKDKLRFFLRTSGKLNENAEPVTMLQYSFDRTINPAISNTFAGIELSFIKIF